MELVMNRKLILSTAAFAFVAGLAFGQPASAADYSTSTLAYGQCAGDCLKKHPEAAKVCYVAKDDSRGFLWIHCDVNTPEISKIIWECDKLAKEAAAKKAPSRWTQK
jgi:hypothetical protein